MGFKGVNIIYACFRDRVKIYYDFGELFSLIGFECGQRIVCVKARSLLFEKKKKNEKKKKSRTKAG